MFAVSVIRRLASAGWQVRRLFQADLKLVLTRGHVRVRAEFGVDLPLCSRQRFGEVPFPGRIGSSIGPPAATQPLDEFFGSRLNLIATL